MNSDILLTLQAIHRLHRLNGANVSEHTRSAQKITRAWQAEVVVSGCIVAEVPVSTVSMERIDLLDVENHTAYELKVSGKNPHHEFYKDLIKVLTYNCNNERKINKLVFISEKSGIEGLTKRIDPGLRKLIRDAHNLEFELVSLDNTEDTITVNSDLV